ncbi:hypothetical protein BKA70DRAFT_1404951 [Coprinopsis sp. MPI-PUGE-AT-0042]|nr:hypothetical protein BKA70DRAFT_1404951 [Coprinopsis sp. MPI-PUGE-AT-0042]
MQRTQLSPPRSGLLLCISLRHESLRSVDVVSRTSESKSILCPLSSNTQAASFLKMHTRSIPSFSSRLQLTTLRMSFRATVASGITDGIPNNTGTLVINGFWAIVPGGGRHSATRLGDAQGLTRNILDPELAGQFGPGEGLGFGSLGRVVGKPLALDESGMELGPVMLLLPLHQTSGVMSGTTREMGLVAIHRHRRKHHLYGSISRWPLSSFSNVNAPELMDPNQGSALHTGTCCKRIVIPCVLIYSELEQVSTYEIDAFRSVIVSSTCYATPPFRLSVESVNGAPFPQLKGILARPLLKSPGSILETTVSTVGDLFGLTNNLPHVTPPSSPIQDASSGVQSLPAMIFVR